MAPKYKLTYFDGRGRGEISRLTFAAAGVAFDDDRISFEDWPKIKPTTPLGTLPVLEVGGKKYAQGMAISTFLAREFGLYGSNNLEGLTIDMIQHQREDLLQAQTKVMFAPDDATKAENKKKLEENQLPTTLKFFCDIVKANGGGYAVGKKLTLADLIIYEGTQACSGDGTLDKYPELKALRSKVESSGSIKAYISKRKETPF